jgi:hypothetical protein
MSMLFVWPEGEAGGRFVMRIFHSIASCVVISAYVRRRPAAPIYLHLHLHHQPSKPYRCIDEVSLLLGIHWGNIIISLPDVLIAIVDDNNFHSNA